MRAAMLSAVLVGVGLAAAGCGPSTAESDEIVGALQDDVTGTSASLLLPTGEVTVTVGAPVQEVPADATRDAEARQAPDGSSFLPVRLEHDLDAAPWGGLLAASPQEAPVTLMVDGVERSLGSPYLAEGRAIATNPERTFFVVVPGSPSAADVTVEIAYDGASQTVGFAGDEPQGVGSELADLSSERPPGSDCPGDAWSTQPPATVRMICEIPLAARTPYWPGSGWSSDEEGWLVLRVDRLEVAEITAPNGTDYEIDRVTGAGIIADLAGGDPVGPLSGTLVLEVAGSSVPFELDVQATESGSTSPLQLRVEYDGAISAS